MRARESIRFPLARMRRSSDDTVRSSPWNVYLFLPSPALASLFLSSLRTFPACVSISAKFRSRWERGIDIRNRIASRRPSCRRQRAVSRRRAEEGEEGRARVTRMFGDTSRRLSKDRVRCPSRYSLGFSPSARGRRWKEGDGTTTTCNPPEQVLEGRDGGRLAAVILVAVDVQHPFAADGQHAREDALLQAGAEDNRVVLLIHVCVGREADRRGGRRKAVAPESSRSLVSRDLNAECTASPTPLRFSPSRAPHSRSLSPAACPSKSYTTENTRDRYVTRHCTRQHRSARHGTARHDTAWRGTEGRPALSLALLRRR